MMDPATVEDLSVCEDITEPPMEADEEIINEFLLLLFPEGMPEDLGRDHATYLKRLGSEGLESLTGEVARLNEELAIVEHQTRDMASQNYQIFVQSSQTTNLIQKSLEDGKSKTEMLYTTMFPSIMKSVSGFKSSVCHSFKVNDDGLKALYSHREKIELILDMPWMVRRCLAEEKLPDAIKILQTVQQCQKYLQDQPLLLKKICNEVMELKTQIQEALLLKLSAPNIGLTECLQTVSLLRSFFPEDKTVRFRFLQSRMQEVSWEQWRSYVFDTLTQHRAAFGGDSNHLLSLWISIQISNLFNNEVHKRFNCDQIDTILLNLSYFGESLARVGADFRGLLTSVLKERISNKFNEEVTKLEIQFVKSLQSFNLSIAATFNTDMKDPDASENQILDMEDLTPPKQLVSYAPLAMYLNGMLKTLNETVGKCCILQVSPGIVNRINESIKTVMTDLEAWGSSEQLTWEIKEQSEFTRLRQYFKHLLVPHLAKVVRHIFPPVDVSRQTGISLSQCSEVLQISCNS